MTYLYDLELNSRNEIIGGEWYNNNHPDFLWHFPKSIKDRKVYHTAYDRNLRNWNGSGVMPASWRNAAMQAAKAQQPLAKIVDLLIKKANQ